jgi:hypothetical protein
MNDNRQNRIAGAAAVAAIAFAGFSAESRASSIGLEFDTQRPGARAAMELHLAYTNPADPGAKPPPIRELTIDAPAGTRFDHVGVPVCEASDAELMASGPGACPPESRIGGGTIVVTTGFGPPFDPFASPTPVFNHGEGWLEVSQDSSGSTTIAVTRLAVKGNRIAGEIAATPGGPPDFQTAVSTVDLGFPAATGYVTTPPRCPRDGRWKTTATYEFGDGTSEKVHDETPCAGRRAAIRVRVRPAAVRAGEQATVRVKLRAAQGCASRAAVRIGRRPPLRADRRGRAILETVFRRPGRRSVTASHPGCAPGKTTLRVRR